MSETERMFAELKQLLNGRMITNVFLDDEEGLMLRLGRRHTWENGTWREMETSDSGDVHVRVHAPSAGTVVIGHEGIADGPERESWSITDPKTPEKIVRVWG